MFTFGIKEKKDLESTGKNFDFISFEFSKFKLLTVMFIKNSTDFLFGNVRSLCKVSLSLGAVRRMLWKFLRKIIEKMKILKVLLYKLFGKSHVPFK